MASISKTWSVSGINQPKKYSSNNDCILYSLLESVLGNFLLNVLLSVFHFYTLPTKLCMSLFNSFLILYIRFGF